MEIIREKDRVICELDLAKKVVDKKLSESLYLVRKFQGNRLTRYLMNFNGHSIEVRSTPDRTRIFGKSQSAILDFVECLGLEEKNA